MKTIIITAALMLGTAANADTMLGCEVVDMGGYMNKADPTCVFENQDVRGSRLGYGDLDNDPTTPDSLGPIDN